MGFNLADLPDSLKRCIPPEVRKSMGKAGLTFNEALLVQRVRQEKDLQKLIRAALNYQDIPFVNARMDKKTTTAVGTPDFVFAVKGMPIAWEIKMPGEQVTKEQEKMHAHYRKNGWVMEVITSLPHALYELKKWLGNDYR